MHAFTQGGARVARRPSWHPREGRALLPRGTHACTRGALRRPAPLKPARRGDCPRRRSDGQLVVRQVLLVGVGVLGVEVLRLDRRGGDVRLE